MDIDVEKVKEKEKEELNEIIKIVKEKEELISQTEMMMQQKSIYSDTYKPQFISEMNEEQLEDFSNVLSQKLRQISVKYKPIPIGIKYSINDPFKSPNEQKKEEFIIYRNQLEGHTKENIEEIENQQSN